MLLPICLGLGIAVAIILGGQALVRHDERNAAQGHLNGIMALGGGFTMALVMLDMLPVAISRAPGGWQWAVGNTLLGAVVVAVVDRLVVPQVIRRSSSVPATTHSLDGPHTHHHGCACHAHFGRGAALSAVGCLISCLLFDGAALGSAMLAGKHLGVMMLTGILLHAVPEGLLVALLSLAAGNPPRQSRQIALLAGTAFAIGMTMPLLLGHLEINVLPFAAGTLLYTVVTHLLPMATASTRGTVLALSGGAGYWLIDSVLNRFS